jgi:hypothetical protein
MVTGAPVSCREIHAAVRLAKGGVMVRFRRRVTQATRGRVISTASCTDGGVSELAWLLSI